MVDSCAVQADVNAWAHSDSMHNLSTLKTPVSMHCFLLTRRREGRRRQSKTQKAVTVTKGS